MMSDEDMPLPPWHNDSNNAAAFFSAASFLARTSGEGVIADCCCLSLLFSIETPVAVLAAVPPSCSARPLVLFSVIIGRFVADGAAMVTLQHTVDRFLLLAGPFLLALLLVVAALAVGLSLSAGEEVAACLPMAIEEAFVTRRRFLVAMADGTATTVAGCLSFFGGGFVATDEMEEAVASCLLVSPTIGLLAIFVSWRRFLDVDF
mmetsp:Transcript_27164/g.58219  ORF Transcript_27164/g.58219 Transcript_27164/m.58219 type:complete len:205 (-) Transcript_27164:781-1395(-)